ICALYHILFQPLPFVLAATLSFVLAYGYHFFTGGSRARLATEIFSHHLSDEHLERLIRSPFDFESPGRNHEATVLVCDIAGKHDLMDGLPSETLALMFDRFVGFAREALLSDGGYVYSADGEGVVALFGFPGEETNHAASAAGAALRL